MKRQSFRSPRRAARPVAAAFALALGCATMVAPAAAAGDRVLNPKTAAGVEAVNRGDHKAAYELFRTQAARGDAEAQFELSMLYALGKGVKRDLVAAYMWAEIAARQKEPYADFIRDEIAANLNGGQITQATGMANDWMRANGYGAQLPVMKATTR